MGPGAQEVSPALGTVSEIKEQLHMNILDELDRVSQLAIDTF